MEKKNQGATIQPCTIEHLNQYGTIYAAAFSGEPWNDNWSVEDATVHVRELIESKQHYGLECVVEGEVVGFILGTSMLFHYGRMFEINDLAIAPQFQHRGLARQLLQQCLADMKEQGIVGFHLITACEGRLPQFYERFGFKKEQRVMLMSL